MKRPADWIMRLMRKKSSVDQVAGSKEGKVFLLWLRNDILKIGQDPVAADGNPFITTANATRYAIWAEIETELSISAQEVVDSAIAFEEEQANAEQAMTRLGIDRTGEAA